VGSLLLATFVDLFATIFNGLIIARIFLGLFLPPQNWLEARLINLTEPLLAPVRRLIPSPGGLDFSPTATVIILYVIDAMAQSLLTPQ
jgi:YggT family protein